MRLRVRSLANAEGCAAGARRRANEFRPVPDFDARFLDHVSYAWQDGGSRESFRLAPIFTPAIPLHLATGVLRMENDLLMTADGIGAVSPS
jgi:hypothetical protein